MSHTLYNGPFGSHAFDLRLSPHRAPAVTQNKDAGIVTCEPRRQKVAICGAGFSAFGLEQMAEHNDEWEIWGFNDGYRFRMKFADGLYSTPFRDKEGRLVTSRWFELHPWDVQPNEDAAWLTLCPVPVYMPTTNKAGEEVGLPEDVPNAVRFPIERIETTLRLPAESPFWACTFAMQIGLAITEGFTTIMLVGLDFGSPREWLCERPNVLWWAGYAAGMGLEVLVPPYSTLLQHPYRYGWDYDKEKRWCEERVAMLTETWRQRKQIRP